MRSVHTRALFAVLYAKSQAHTQISATHWSLVACRHIFSGAARDTAGLPKNQCSQRHDGAAHH